MSLETVKKRFNDFLKKMGEHQHNLSAKFINEVQEGRNGIEKIIKTYEDNVSSLKKTIDDSMHDFIPLDFSYPNFSQIYKRIAELSLAEQMRDLDNILKRLEDQITVFDTLLDKELLEYNRIQASNKSDKEEDDVSKIQNDILSIMKQAQDLNLPEEQRQLLQSRLEEQRQLLQSRLSDIFRRFSERFQQIQTEQPDDALAQRVAPAMITFINSVSPTPNHASDSSPARGAQNSR